MKAAELGGASPTPLSWARDSQLMDGASFCSSARPFFANSSAAWPAAPPPPALLSRPYPYPYTYPISAWALGRGTQQWPRPSPPGRREVEEKRGMSVTGSWQTHSRGGRGEA